VGELSKEKRMRCVVCSGQDIERKRVEEEVRMENDVVWVPVELPVCRSCGERYYDRRTVRFLEEVEQRLRDEKPTLREIGKVLRYG
jgi:YgiT-type zinc finger domain-containing protein